MYIAIKNRRVVRKITRKLATYECSVILLLLLVSYNGFYIGT